MRTSLAALAVLSVAVVAIACASSGGGAASARRDCGLLPADSVFAAHAPLYRDCAVTTKARLLTTDVRPDFTPATGARSGGARCYSAEYEFVITPEGTVDVATARLLKSNSPELSDAIRAMLPRLKYAPATRDGTAVAQIGLYRTATQTTIVAVPMGTSPSSVRPARTRPAC